MSAPISRLVIAAGFAVLLAFGPEAGRSQAPRRVTIEGDHFTLDGQPIQIISGEMHYARIPREYWRDRMKKARAMGLNAITTYVFWNLHEPRPGVWDFSGNLDVAEFVREAQQEGLFVILRPGPYVCSEWDLGGLPAWLLANPDMVLRSRDERFLGPAERYLAHVGRELAPLQLARGGPIVAVQVENEYGSFDNDHQYMARIRDGIVKAGFDSVLLYTADGPSQLAAGTLPDVPAVVNFGPGEAERAFNALAAFRPGAPMMAGEYWAGWFDHWGGKHHTTDREQEAQEIDWMLGRGYSLSIYMFHGGTTFGFMNGANIDDTYLPQTTSYDYDAPLDEAGRPTVKFAAFRDAIAKHRPGTTLPPVPDPTPAMSVARFQLTDAIPLFSVLPDPIASTRPRSMESIGQSFGYTLYRTHVTGPASGDLVINDIRDYVVIYIDSRRVGVLDRRLSQQTLPIEIAAGSHRLDFLVENTGRVNFKKELRNERKGITKSVTLGGRELTGWQIFALPMAEISRVDFSPPRPAPARKRGRQRARTTPPRPAPSVRAGDAAFYRGTFDVAEPADTFLDMRGWDKGQVWINGHNLGRFWSIGPQRSLYLPAPWLQRGRNTVVVFSLEPPAERSLAGVENPIFDR